MMNTQMGRQFVETQVVSMRDFYSDPNAGDPTPAQNTYSVDETVKTDPSYSVAGHPMGTPLAWLFVFIALFVVGRYLLEVSQPKDSSRFAELKLSIWNMFLITLYAVPGIVIVKTLSVKYLNPNNPIARLVGAV